MTHGSSRPKVAVLISGRGSNMSVLIRAAKAADYPAEIALVLSNVPGAEGLSIAAAQGIATFTLDHKTHASREAFEAAIDATLEMHGIELVCLAGFMRVLTPWLIARWTGRMINIHPSLLPSFRGLHTHERALNEGVRLHGCTVHYVIPELDAGPIIAQAAVPVQDDDTPGTLGSRVLEQEHRLYPQVLSLLARQQIRLESGRVVFASGQVSPSASLTSLLPIQDTDR